MKFQSTAKLILLAVVIIGISAGVLANNKHNRIVYDQKTQSQQKKVTIGGLLPLTGFGAYWGEPVRKGMDLAREDLINKGYNIDVIYEDTAGESKTAVTAARAQLAEYPIDAFFVEFSSPSSAVSPIALENEKIMMYDSLDASSAQTNKFAFKIYYNLEKECSTFASYAQTQKVTKIAYIGPNVPFVDECLTGLQSVFNIKNILIEATSDPSETDYKSALTKAKEFNAQYIVSMAYEGNYRSMMKQKEELDISIPLFCAKADCLNENITNNISLDTLNGTIVFDATVDGDFSQKFINKYPDATKVDIFAAASGYDGVQYLARSITQCADNDINCVSHKLEDTGLYQSQIESSGFTQERLFGIHSSYYRVENGKLQPVNFE